MLTQEDIQDIDATLDHAKAASYEDPQGLPEAPAVSNIKVWIKGYGVMLTIRGDKMMDIIKKTEKIVDYAESHRWKNTWDTSEKQQKPVVGQPTAPQVLCGIHGTPMKFHETGQWGPWYSCSQKNADGTFCKWKPKKS